jgi:hypothetical protein
MRQSQMSQKSLYNFAIETYGAGKASDTCVLRIYSIVSRTSESKYIMLHHYDDFNMKTETNTYTSSIKYIAVFIKIGELPFAINICDRKHFK